jgi:flagellar biogenesis protein FliO
MNLLLASLEVQGSAARLGAAQGPDLTRYFTVLGILLAAIVALAFGFKKLFAGAMRAKAAKRHLAIVDLLPLGGKQRLAVVRCYDRTFALGLGEKEVALIAELDAVNAEGRGLCVPPPAERAEFAKALQRMQGEHVAETAPASEPTPAPTTLGRTRVGRRVRELLGATLGSNGVVG